MKKTLSLALSTLIALIPCSASAIFFTIQLHNGNTIKTEKYLEQGHTILFYTPEGSVRIPTKIISLISTNDGMIRTQSRYFPKQDFEEEELIRDKSKKTDEIKNDLKDRISVTTTNIENLLRNKSTYQNKKKRYQGELEKARSRKEKLKTDTYITSQNLRERTEIEERKIMDAEANIKDVDSQILNNEKMIESQNRMQQRLENELKKL